MAGKIIYMPEDKSGMDWGALAQAFGNVMQTIGTEKYKKNLEEEQRKKRFEELGIGKQEITPQGKQWFEKQVGGEDFYTNPEKMAQIQGQPIPKIPQKYYKTVLDIEKAKQLPAGMEIPLGYGTSYRVPQPSAPTYIYNPSTNKVEPLNLPTGEPVPPKSKVITQPESPEAKQEREITTASRKESQIRANKLNELNKAINFFETKIDEIPGSSGIEGRLQGLGTVASGVLQTDPKAAAYMASTTGLRSQIARGLGEVGNLSEYEQKYAVRLLPQITDNLETRAAKLQNFRDYIKMRLGNQQPQGQPQDQDLDPLGLR